MAVVLSCGKQEKTLQKAGEKIPGALREGGREGANILFFCRVCLWFLLLPPQLITTSRNFRRQLWERLDLFSLCTPPPPPPSLQLGAKPSKPFGPGCEQGFWFCMMWKARVGGGEAARMLLPRTHTSCTLLLPLKRPLQRQISSPEGRRRFGGQEQTPLPTLRPPFLQEARSPIILRQEGVVIKAKHSAVFMTPEHLKGVCKCHCGCVPEQERK